jgi:hypothetical protein
LETLKCSLLLFTNLHRDWGVTHTHTTELLGSRNKSIVAGDLNAKLPVWNSEVSNISGLKILALFVSSYFEISAPQCSTRFTTDGRGDVLNNGT